MPKLNLYRNISITFMVFVVVLLLAVFLFISNGATIIIVPNPQQISLSFNLEVKPQPTADELLAKDIVAGQIESYVKKGTITSEVLSTKTVDSQIVGQVKIINESNKNQNLVKTTQLQAANGVIVRTNDNVIVPAGGSVNIAVVAKDPLDFKDVEPGKLIIIKLNPALQDKIYAVADKTLNNDPQTVKVLTASDITRAKEKLSQQLIEAVKAENNISANNGLITQIKNFKTDQQIGDEVENFNLEMEVEVKALKFNEEQLASLILKKVTNLNLSGLVTDQINVSDVGYTIIDDNLAGHILVKINYLISAKINENNALLNKANLVGQNIENLKELLSHEDIIGEVEILVSPYWTKNLPKQESKIDIIIR